MRSSGTVTTPGVPNEELSTNVVAVHELISNSSLNIPEYQRPYTWNTHNILSLIEDIQRFSSADQYRIGTVIVHQNDDKRDIVDGQQRYLSFGLIALALNGHRNDLRDDVQHMLSKGLKALIIRVRRDGVSSRHLRENFNAVREFIGSWTPTQRQKFAAFFLQQCSVVHLSVRDLDAAFQMFDSQNTRGRPLYPSDLLKAYHLREVSRGDDSQRALLESTRMWEKIDPQEIDHLFSGLLFPIIEWTRGSHLPSRGFSAHQVGHFKGIREGARGRGRHPWAHQALMAKAFVDEYTARNDTLIRNGVLEPLEYPFQITGPVIDGQMFFRMVSHYGELSRCIGIVRISDTDPEPEVLQQDPRLREVLRRVRKAGDGRGDVYVRNLFNCLLLAYVDRFGTERLGEAAERLARHAYLIRYVLIKVQKGSVENHALGEHDSVPKQHRVNLLRAMSGWLDTDAFLSQPPCAEPVHMVDERRSPKQPVQNIYTEIQVGGDGLDEHR